MSLFFLCYNTRMSKTNIEKSCGAVIFDSRKKDARVLIIRQLAGHYCFVKGHIEPNETEADTALREIKEETGLTISNPRPCGYKDWIQEDGTRYIVLLYKTNQYSGEILASDEGRVFWLDRNDITDANLIWNMRELLEIFESDDYSEFFFRVGVDINPNKNNLLG